MKEPLTDKSALTDRLLHFRKMEPTTFQLNCVLDALLAHRQAEAIQKVLAMKPIETDAFSAFEPDVRPYNDLLTEIQTILREALEKSNG